MTMDDYRKLKEKIENSGMLIRRYCLKHNLRETNVYSAFRKMKEQDLSLTVIDVPDGIKERVKEHFANKLTN